MPKLMTEAPTEPTPLPADPKERRIFHWQGPNDTSRLADVIAEACVTELFSDGGALKRLVAGELVPLNRDSLRDFLAERIAGVKLVNHGASNYQVEIHAFSFAPYTNTNEEPDQRMLVELMKLLAERVVRVPSAPPKLSEQQRQEIRARARSGEPPERIAPSYGVDVATVRELGRP